VKSEFGALILAIVAAPVLLGLRGLSQSTAPPLHRYQLLKLVENYVPSERLADLVKQRGIDFEPTEEFIKGLQKAGAEPVLLDALREARVVKPGAARNRTTQQTVVPQVGGAGSEPQQGAESDSAAQHAGVSQSEADRSRAHLEAGRVLLAQNKLDEAMAEMHEALRFQPDSAETHRALSAALFQKGDLDGAIAEYRQAIRLGPDDAGAHINLGLALYMKDDLDGATAEYREAVRLDPNDPANHFMLGYALTRRSDLDGAIAEFREAVRLRPDYAAAHDALGSALERKNDLHSALDQYRIAHNLKPNNLDYRSHYEHLSHALQRGPQ